MTTANTSIGAPVFGPFPTLAEIIAGSPQPFSFDLWFADGFGTFYGTGAGAQPDSGIVWDAANEWLQLAIPGAGGAGLAELRLRGDFSRVGAADTFGLNQWLAGALTLTAGVTQTVAGLFHLIGTTQATNAVTMTDFATLIVDEPAAPTGTATRRSAIYSAGAIQLATTKAVRWTNAGGAFSIADTVSGATGGIAFTSQGGWVITNYSAIVDMNWGSGEVRYGPGAVLSFGERASALAAGTSGFVWNSSATSPCLMFGAPTTSRQIQIVAYPNRSDNYAHAAQSNPTFFGHSVTPAATATDEWWSITHDVTNAVLAWGSGALSLPSGDVWMAATKKLYLDGGGDTYIEEESADTIHVVNAASSSMRVTGAVIATYRPEIRNHYGDSSTSALNTKSVTELLTIAAGSGAAGVATAGNLAPAGSLILGATVRVTQAPGGGATTFDLGVTAGDLDGFADNVAVALGTTGTSLVDGEAAAVRPLYNRTATTLTLTTDANVTGASMIVRITVHYIDLTAPSA